MSDPIADIREALKRARDTQGKTPGECLAVEKALMHIVPEIAAARTHLTAEATRIRKLPPQPPASRVVPIKRGR